MIPNETTVLGGFDMISNMITGKPVDEISTLDNVIPEIEPEDIPGFETEDETPEVEPEEVEDDESEEVEEPLKGPINHSGPKGVEGPPGIPDEDPETEALVSQLLQEKLSAALNYEFDEKEKFTKVQDVVDYLETLVENASAPQYANDEVAKLDEYVKNGGDLKKYFDTVYERNFDIDDVDITDPSDQKRVIKEALKEQGVKDDIITKRIERYENNGALDDEAMEAQEYLIENKSVKEQKLLAAQREQSTQIKERQREFVGTVEQSINKLTEVRGIKVTNQEKKELLDYILRPTADGMTKYQKDYVSKDRYINNLIESAFFTKNGDALIKRAKEQATSDTYKNIQKKLQDKKDTRISGSGGQTSKGNNLDLSRLSSFIIKQ